MAQFDGSINIDAKLNIKNAVINSKDLGKAIESLKSTVDTFGKDAAQSTNAYVGVLAKASTVLSDVGSVFSGIESGAQQMIGALSDTSLINKSWEDLKTEMSDLQTQLEAFKEAGLTSDDWQYAEVEERLKDVTNAVDAKGFSMAADSIKNDIEILLQQLELLGSAEGVDPYLFEEFAQSIPSVISQISWLSERYKALSRESESAGQTMADSIDSANEPIQDLQTRLDDIVNSESDVQDGTQELETTLTQGADEASEDMDSTASATNRVAESLAKAAISAGKFIVKLASGTIRLAANAIKSVGSAAIRAAANLAKMVGSGALSFLRKLADGAKNAAIQLAKMVGNAVVTGVKKIGSLAARATKSLLGLNKASSGDGFKEGLRFIVRYGFGVRSLFMLFRKLRGAIVEAFENMAQKVPEVNKTISSLVSSLDQVKNSLATAFQPILTAVAPYLIQLMDMLTMAMTKVGEFFAALTGQNYVYRATKAQKDYASSLDKTRKKAKAAENQLAGFDHLNILKDSKNDSSSSGADDAAAQTSDFQKLPVESWIKDLADRIKALFKKSDFFGIGKLLAKQLNRLIDKINFKQLGKKVAKGINAVVDIINGLFDNINFIALGKKLSEAFMALVNGVNWYNLGRAMTQKIRAIIEGLWGFVSGLNWNSIGKAIGDYIQGAFDNIPWETLGTLIGTSITGVFQAIYTAAETFEWGEIGKRLSEGFKNIVDNIDIDTIYAALHSVLIGILDLIGPVLTDTQTWNKIAADFAKFLNKLFQDDTLWDKLKNVLLGGIRTAISSLKTFVSTFEWGANGKKFHDRVFLLINDFPLNELGTALSGLLTGALEFMNDAFGDEQLFSTLGGKLSTFLHDVLGKKEFWSEAGTAANNMMKGILAFAEGFLNDFSPTDAAENIKVALGKIDWNDIATKTWTLLKTALNKAGNFVDALFSESVSENAMARADGSAYWSGVVDSVNTFNSKSLGEKIGAKVSQAIGSIDWGAFGSDLSTATVKLFNTIADFFKETREQGKLQEAFSSFINNINWSEIAASVIEAAWEAFKTIGATLWQAVVDGMTKNREETEAREQEYAKEWSNSLVGAFYTGVIEKLQENEDVKTHYQEAMDGILQSADMYGGGETDAERFYNGFIGTITENGTVKEEYRAAIEGIYGSVDNFMYGTDDIEVFFMGFADALSKIPTGEGSAFYNLMTAIFSSIDTAEEGRELATDAADGMVSGFESKESEVADAMKETLYDNPFDDKLRGKEGYDSHSPSRTTKALGEDVVEGFEIGIEGKKTDLENTMSSALGGMVDISDEKWAEAKDGQQAQLNAIKQNLSVGMQSMKTETQSGSNSVQAQTKPFYDQWKAANWIVEQSLNTMVRKLTSAMGEMEQSVQNGMNSLRNDINNAMQTIGNMNWSYIGQNICNGIGQGIHNGWNWLNNTVWNLANSLFRSAKNALGIHSPSTLFRDEVGYMVGAGLAEGLDDSQHEVLSSVTDMAKAMVDEMQTTDLTADVGVNDDTLLSSISDALSTFNIKIEDSFITLTERLQAIAEKVTFVTPDIVAGTVLPYAIQGNKNASADDIATALEKNNEELIRIMIQLVNNQTSAIVSALERYCTTNVNIDKKSLTDAIVEEVNRRTRAMGISPLLS